MAARSRLFLTLFAAIAVFLFAAQGFSQDRKAPVPAHPAPRVPFTAFRIKPNLKPAMPSGSYSESVLFSQPARKPVQPSEPIKPVQRMAVKTAPVPSYKPAAPIIPQEAERNLAKILNDIDQVQDAPPVLPRPLTVMTPPPSAQNAMPRPPVMADDLPLQVPPKITAQPAPTYMRRPGRFSTSRTAGSTTGSLIREGRTVPDSVVASVPLTEAQGTSPIQIPGHLQKAPVSPYAAKSDARGLPSEVVVFFQENSPEMEVGQKDVLNDDVIIKLQESPDLRVDITGYSESGPDAVNLARSRGAMIRDYLRAHDIDGNRLTVTGKGDDTDVEPRDRAELFFTR